MNTQSISTSKSFLYKFIAIILIAVLGLAATPILMVSADSTGYYAPTKAVSHGPGWANPANIRLSDGMYVTAIKNNKQLKLSNFYIPAIPGNSVINGIEVTVEGFTAGIQAEVAISGGPGGFTSAKTTTLTGTESTLILGGPTDNWGKNNWSSSDFTNSKFLVRLISNGTVGTLSIDQVQVKVYYTRPNTTLVLEPVSGNYGGTTSMTATLTVTSSGAALSGKTINFSLNGISAGSAVTDGSGVATLNASLAGINAGDYPYGAAASYAGGAGTDPTSITADLYVHGIATTIVVNPASGPYNGSTGSITATLTETVSGNPIAGKTLQFTLDDISIGSAVTDSFGVASVPGVSLSGYDAGLYAGAFDVTYAGEANIEPAEGSGDLTVNKITLTVTADNQTKGSGTADPVFTFSYSGFVGSDTAADLDTAPTCGVSGPHAGPGSYAIVCSGGVDNNYAFSYVNGTLTVNAVGTAPTNISLSKSDINEGLPAGTTIGLFSTTDADPGETFTYDFCGGTDDASFTIAGNALKSGAVFNWTTKHTYSICIRSTDSNALSTTKTFAITINKTSATFQDVPMSYWSWIYIERLYAAGVTGGCGTNPLIYCPTAAVTRDQMAVFLLKGEHGSSYVPPAVGVSTGFSDVPTTHWAAAWIKQLAAEGITAGCGGGKFCPGTAVTRDQMAVFLLKAKHGTGYVPPVATGVFTDVPTNYWAAAWIERLAAEGITSGCNVSPAQYCPGTPVTRDQMAVFLVRTFNLP
jgi:hypothetical protein